MYFLIAGEVEVTSKANPGIGEETRLGFLSEGAFFGEAPVLGDPDDHDMQLRKRTVRAVTASELCFLTRDAVRDLCDDYAELKARVARFRNSSRVMNNRTLKKMDLSPKEMEQLTKQYKARVRISSTVRNEKNLHDGAYIPVRLAWFGCPLCPRCTDDLSRKRSFVLRLTKCLSSGLLVCQMSYLPESSSAVIVAAKRFNKLGERGAQRAQREERAETEFKKQATREGASLESILAVQ